MRVESLACGAGPAALESDLLMSTAIMALISGAHRWQFWIDRGGGGGFGIPPLSG